MLSQSLRAHITTLLLSFILSHVDVESLYHTMLVSLLHNVGTCEWGGVLRDLANKGSQHEVKQPWNAPNLKPG